jgi:DNA-binding CsgD family transcriptional regulator
MTPVSSPHLLCGRSSQLTARQPEVLQLSVRGLSGKQIARRIGISVRTVEDHFSAMRLRTGGAQSKPAGRLRSRMTGTGVVANTAVTQTSPVRR